MKHLIYKITLLGVLIALSTNVSAQEENKEFEPVCIAFYNLENLFDTLDAEGVSDGDFTPTGGNAYTSERYQKKLENLSYVISKIGTETTPDGPAILGVCELETEQVLLDLCAMPAIKDRGYKVVHYDSPYYRGMDVALLYNPKYFTVESSQSFELNDPDNPDFTTRAQLLVTGDLMGERMHFMVNHWPSKSGGEKRSRPKRIMAAKLGVSIIDSIRAAEPDAKIIYMGDLNDDPTSESVRKHMRANGKTMDIDNDELYNPMWDLHKKGIGSHAWRDTWSLIDQMLISKGLVTTNKEFDDFRFYKAMVFNKKFLTGSEGSFKGYPFRTYVGSSWQGGYSDHFPVYLYLIREVKN